MPSTSAKQRKFMQAAAHSPGFAKRAGISQTVARDFARHDGTYAAGGRAMMPRNLLAEFQAYQRLSPDQRMQWADTQRKNRGALGVDPRHISRVSTYGDDPMMRGGALSGGGLDPGAPFVRGQGPRPEWWPEDRPWASGDIGYGVGALGDQPGPTLPETPGAPAGILGGLAGQQPGILGPFVPPDVSRPPIPSNVWSPALDGLGQFEMPDNSPGGGGGGMADGGRVGALRRFWDGGDVGDAGSAGERDNTAGGDMSGALGSDQDPEQSVMDAVARELSLSRDKMRESKEMGRGAIGWGQALSEAIEEHSRVPMMSPEKLTGMLPWGLGLVSTLGQIAARANEKAGGYNDYGGGGTDAGIHGDGALGEPPATVAPGGAPQAPAAPPAPALRLPSLQQPQFDPRTYGFGPALAWLR